MSKNLTPEEKEQADAAFAALSPQAVASGADQAEAKTERPEEAVTAAASAQDQLQARRFKELDEQAKASRERRKMQEQQRVADFEAGEKSLGVRVADAGLGRIEHLGCPGEYIGESVGRDRKAKCPACDLPLTPGSTRFTPLDRVTPEAGMRVKLPGAKEFFTLPFDQGYGVGSSPAAWGSVMSPDGKPLVPVEADPKASQTRREAAKLPAA